MQQPIKLTYKDYLLTIRFSLFRLIELHGTEVKVDTFIDTRNNQILSIIIEPKSFNYKKVTVNIVKLLAYTIIKTNTAIDPRVIILRLHRYLNRYDTEMIAAKLGIEVRTYKMIEEGYNADLFDKWEKQLGTILNINFNEYKEIIL